MKSDNASCCSIITYGAWRSPVAHLLWERGERLRCLGFALSNALIWPFCAHSCTRLRRKLDEKFSRILADYSRWPSGFACCESVANRKVALKVRKTELAAVVGAERFLAAIKTTANLQHPHILPLFDSGEADGFLSYVMPFVDGETLRDRLDREKQLPIDDAVALARKVAAALQAV